jgi:hypothetical protein
MLRVAGRLLIAESALQAALPVVNAKEGITSVYSRASADYVRATLPDGTYQNETYAFGKGGYQGAAIYDQTIDNLTFTDVAHVIAGPLADQNFVPTRDPNTTKLLIMVYWGATDGSMDFSSLNIGGSGQSFGASNPGGLSGLGAGWWGAGDTRVQMADTRNAALLGYLDELAKSGSGANRSNGDLINEVEFSRYFVVLLAYDFQLLWRHNQRKLLWESRFSIREQGNDFTMALPAMAKYASVYFGKDSHGLLRTRVPDGRIYMGDPTVIEFLADSGK